jgi:carbamoyl-phosphate synthase small subunit
MTNATNPLAFSAVKTAQLLLTNGMIIEGYGIGATGSALGELCFNTAMTGYQEILTDPSYKGQIITFTFPHIGNVGTNAEDVESAKPVASGLVIRENITNPANYRNLQHLDAYLKTHNIVGICGVDTRALTQAIRDGGVAPNGIIIHAADGNFDTAQHQATLKAWQGLVGLDLAKDVTTEKAYPWHQGLWQFGTGYPEQRDGKYKVVCVDYGVKYNILRNLVNVQCEVEVVPATTPAKEILAHNPDGIFLSNGPGDPFATGQYALPIIKELLNSGKPIFGICLGFQLLALALGAKTAKMPLGHHGANHPVQDLQTGKVEITSQNHGFHVVRDSLPTTVKATHISLFDGTLQGFRCADKPVFAVQGHPEASPGPEDSAYLFQQFVEMMQGAEVSHRAARTV